MQLKRLPIIIPFLAALFTGCIKEDLSDCPPEYNLEFLFEYTTEPNSTFTDLIKSVDLLLFDADSYFLQHRRSAEADLAAFQGMRFYLPPGTYYAVAWGNVGNRSSFSSLTATTTLFSQCYLQIAEQANDGGDPIFYAPQKEVSASAALALYEVNVWADRSTVKRLDFTKAYRTTNVWIYGYEQSGLGESIQPTVNAGKLWSMYDFYLATLNSRRDFSLQTHNEERSGEHYSLSTFYSALGEINGETDIDVIRTSDNRLVHTLNLRQFVADNNITNTNRIDILITFLNDLDISVTVPQWAAKPVQPGVK